MRGSSAPNGSWNTIWMARRDSRRVARSSGLPWKRRAPGGRALQPGDEVAERALAAAALADQGKGLAGSDVKADVFDRVQGLAADGEGWTWMSSNAIRGGNGVMPAG